MSSLKFLDAKGTAELALTLALSGSGSADTAAGPFVTVLLFP